MTSGKERDSHGTAKKAGSVQGVAAAPGLPCKPTIVPGREPGWEMRGSGRKQEENVKVIRDSHPGDNPDASKAGPALTLQLQLMPTV